MLTRGILGAVMALAVAMSGCVQGGADAATKMSEKVDSALYEPLLEENATEPVEVEAPVWQVGDAWSITSRGFGAEQRSFLVVTAAGTDSYTLGTSSEDAAGFDAMFDISYIGKIRASDLAGYQQDAPVKYFDFPLADGKTWSTQWDGWEVVLTATKTPRGFSISGTVDGTPYVEYDYVPDLRWLSHIHFVQGDYGFSVDRFETEWRGTLASATADVVYEVATQTPAGSPGSGAFTIDEGQTFGMVTLAGGGAQWARAFTLVDPSGAPHSTTAIENAEAEAMGPRGIFLQETIPPTPGQWHIAAPTVHDPTGGFWITIHQVAVTTTPFP